MPGKWKLTDWLAVVLFFIFLFTFIRGGGITMLVLSVAVGIFLVFRLLLLIGRKPLWKIRNRLIVSSLFFIVTPMLLITVFFLVVSSFLVIQYNSLILENLMQRNLEMINANTDRLLSLENVQQMSQSLEILSRRQRQGINTVLFERGMDASRWVSVLSPEELPVSELDLDRLAQYFHAGYFCWKGVLYQGVLKFSEKIGVFRFQAIDQAFFNRLPQLGDFRVMYEAPPKKDQISILRTSRQIAQRLDSKEFSGFAKNRFSFPYNYRYRDFDEWKKSGPAIREFMLLMIIDYSRIIERLRGVDPVKSLEKKIARMQSQTAALPPGEERSEWERTLRGLVTDLDMMRQTQSQSQDRFFMLVMVLPLIFLGMFIILSIWIGFRIVRVITQSVDQMTKGLERIRRGDFTYRIHIHSHDQMHYLAESFNEMTSGIDRLLKEEKERQRLEEELRIARSIQLRLLPPDQLACGNFELAAVNIPAQEIGGDYFDYFHRPGESLTVLVADVSGKGASAAFYMAELKGVMNYLQTRGLSPRDIIAECHNSLLPSFDRVTYITLNLVVFHIAEHRLVLARAGHTPPLFYEASTGNCREITPEGPAVGLSNFSREAIQEMSIPCQAGDILFFYSDGLSEMMNPEDEILGTARLREIIRKNSGEPVEVIRKRILDHAVDFSQSKNSHDDLTFVVIKIR